MRQSLPGSSRFEPGGASYAAGLLGWICRFVSQVRVGRGAAWRLALALGAGAAAGGGSIGLCFGLAERSATAAEADVQRKLPTEQAGCNMTQPESSRCQCPKPGNKAHPEIICFRLSTVVASNSCHVFLA